MPVELSRWNHYDAPASRPTVTVTGSRHLMLTALLFTRNARAEVSDRIVRAAQAPGVRSSPPSLSQPSRLELDLDWLPEAVTKVVIAADLPLAGPSLGTLTKPLLRLADHRGVTVAEYPLTWLTTEYAVVLCELSRRDGRWRLHTRDDGYGDGLAGLIARHGFDAIPEPAPDPAAERAALARILGLPTAPDGFDALDVYRAVRERLAAVPAEEHPAYLQMAARCLGADELADAIAATATAAGRRLAWTADWAVWRSNALPDTTLYGPVGHVGTIAFGAAAGRPVVAAVAHAAVAQGSVAGVHVWDAVTGDPLGFDRTGHLDAAASGAGPGSVAGATLTLAFTVHSGRSVVVTGDLDGTLRYWDAASGRPVGDPVRGHAGSVRALAVGELDGRPVVVSGGADGILRRWNGAGRPVGEPLAAHAGAIRALATGTLGGRPVVASGGADGTVRVWDLATGQPAGPPVRQDGPVSALAFGEVAGQPAVARADGAVVRIHHAATGRPLGPPLSGHTDAVLALALADVRGRSVLVTGGADATLLVWDPAVGASLGAPIPHTAPVTSLAVGRIGTRTAVVFGRDAVRRLDLDALVRPAAATPAGPAVSAAHTGDVQAVTYGVRHGRTFLATGGRDGTVRVLDPDTGALLAPPLTGHDEVLSMAYATQKGVPFLMTCGRDGLRLWRPDSLTLWAGPHVPWEPTATNTWLPDGRQVHAVAQRNYELKVLDMATRTPMYPNLRGHVAPIRAVAFGTARGRWAIATGGDDNTIRLWDMFAGQPIGDPLVGHLGPVWGLSFGVLPDTLPAGPLGFLASASSDGTVRLWDPDTGTPVHTAAPDPLRAAGHHLPRRIDLGVPAYGVACAPPPGPARLAVVTEAGTVLLRLPAATPDNRRMP